MSTALSMRRLVLVRRKLIYRRSLLRQVLLLAEPSRRLAKAARRLTKAALLIVQLPRRSSHLSATNGRRLVRPAQQDVLLVHHRVVDEHPLVVRFLLVVDANGRILAQAGDTDDGSATESLVPACGIRTKARTSLLVGVRSAARSQAEGVGERTVPLLGIPLRRVSGKTSSGISSDAGLLLGR